MNSNPSDSGLDSQYNSFRADETKPQRKENVSIPTYLITKIDSNIDNIKSDIQEIKFKVDFDSKALMASISIGVVSSFIVSIFFLLISSNAGNTAKKILGIEIPIFILLVLAIVLSVFPTIFITKWIVLRKIRKDNTS